MKIYQLAKGVCQYYRSKVNNNENLSSDIIQRKLTRNIFLGKRIGQNKKNPNTTLYVYGNLEILLDETDNKIVWIRNNKGRKTKFRVNARKKMILNRELGLMEGVESNE